MYRTEFQNKIYAFCFLLFLLGIALNASGQPKEISGIIINAEDNQPIAFVAVALMQTGMGTVSDIDGKFNLDVPAGYQGSIQFRHVSYQPMSLPLTKALAQSTFKLKKNTIQLKDFVFESGENPADQIIGNVIKNRKNHDPKKLDSYSYQTYTKEIYRLDGDRKTIDSLIQHIKTKDTLQITSQDSSLLAFDNIVSTSHLFVSESVTDVKSILSGMQNETVLATHISGFNSGLFAATGSQYQPFGFYDDVILLLDKEYISPINASALRQYDFYIEDTTFISSDTVYILSFAPKKNKRFEALRGFISININGYAVTNVMAESSDDLSKVKIRIQQLYDKIDGRWFPVQLNTDVLFKEYEYYGLNLIIENKRYLSDINIEANLRPGDFSDVALSIQQVEERQQQQLLDDQRVDPLDSLESNTFLLLDSLTSKLRVVENIFEVWITQRIGMGIIDLKIDDILTFNSYEKIRLGLGLVTNDRFSEKLRVGGYGGYGFGDKDWKYGGDIRWEFDRRTSTHVLFQYKHDIREAGAVKYFDETRSRIGDAIRSWQGDLFDKQELYKVSLNTRVAPFIYAQTAWTRSEEKPTYDYNYTDENFSGNEYQINEFSLSLRYVRNEQYLDLYGRKVLFGYDFPIIEVKVSYGNTDWLAGDFEYTKIDARIEYKKKYRWGKSSLIFRGGYIRGALPFGHLLTGWGSRPSRLSVPNYFQTMGLYEFLSDRAVALFFNHNFGNVLISTRAMKPELILYQNSGIGSLTHPERHALVDFKTMEEGYFESGIGLKNLIRMNYLDVAYLGFGVDVFYRYGAYRLAQTRDNLVFKFNINLSF